MNRYIHDTINLWIHFVELNDSNAFLQTIECGRKDFKSTCENTNEFNYINEAADRFVFNINMGLVTAALKFEIYFLLNFYAISSIFLSPQDLTIAVEYSVMQWVKKNYIIYCEIKL